MGAGSPPRLVRERGSPGGGFWRAPRGGRWRRFAVCLRRRQWLSVRQETPRQRIWGPMGFRTLLHDKLLHDKACQENGTACYAPARPPKDITLQPIRR
jgi:hypothetical protein